MAESFDPYHKWLGIPPAHQPPTHYRLLGIEQFESDREVIDAAANQRMLYLQDLAGGQFIKESQKLLNEVAGARRCLLNVEAKAQYDAELQIRLSASKPAVPVATVIAPPVARPVAPVATQLVAPVAQAVPDTESIEADLFAALSDVDVSAPTTSPSSATASPRRSSSPANLTKRLQWLVSVLAVAVFVVIAVVAGPSLFKPKEAKPGKVTIRWPLNERDGAKMLIDDESEIVQKSESFSLIVPAGKHLFVFKRRGSLNLEKPLTVKPGGQHRIDATLWWPDQASRSSETESDQDIKPKNKSTTKSKAKK